MATPIEIEIQVEGGDEAQAQFEKLRLSEMKAGEQAASLTKQLRDLQKAEGDNTKAIEEVRLALVRTRAAQQGYASEANRMAAASRRSAEMLENSRKAAQNAGRAQGMLVNSIAELGYSLGTAIPGMQTYGTQLAMMGGNAVTFGASLGPVGVAIGVLTGLLPVAISALHDFGDASDAAADDQRSLERETKNANNALRAQIELLNTRERQARLRGPDGIVTGEDADAEQQRLQGEIDRQRAQVDQGRRDLERAMREAREARQRFDELRRSGRVSRTVVSAEQEERQARERVARLRQMQSTMEARLEATRQEQARAVAAGLGADIQDRLAAEEEEEERNEDRQRARRHRVTEEEREAERKRLEMLRSGMEAEIAIKQERNERLAELERQRLENERATEDKMKADRALAAEEEAREAQRRAREMEKAQEEAQRRLERQRAEQERAAAQFKADVESQLAPALSGLTGAVSEVIAGTKNADEAFQGLLASFLEMIAQQTALQAAKEFAEAIAAFARYDYSGGAQHIAAGAAYTAVAIAAGAGAIAVAPPSESVPESPQQSAGQGSQGGGQVVLNINSPIVTAGTRAELGRELKAVIAEGDRRFAA